MVSGRRRPCLVIAHSGHMPGRPPGHVMPPGRVLERFTVNGAEILVKLMKFAVGLAVGYVLGSRAGREKYEQIVAGLHTVRSHPAVQEAQQAANDLLQAGRSTPTVEPVPDTQGLDPAAPITARHPERHGDAAEAPARRRVR